MDPSAPFPSQHHCNLATGEQPDLVAVHIPDRQQLIGNAEDKDPRKKQDSDGASAKSLPPRGLARIRKNKRLQFGQQLRRLGQKEDHLQETGIQYRELNVRGNTFLAPGL